MTLKSVVGWALFLSFFLSINIFILGMFSAEVFFVVYFLFILGCVLVGVALIKSVFNSRADVLFFIFLGIILSLSLTFYVSEFKNYYDVSGASVNGKDVLALELENIQKQNAYDAKYVDYQLNLLSEYGKDNQELQVQVESSLVGSSDIKDDTIKELQDALDLANEQINELLDVIEKLNNLEPQIVYVPVETEDDDEHEDDEDD